MNADDIVATIFLIVLVLFGLVLVSLPWTLEPIAFHFNKSECSVWVNYNMVYNGYCHFVDVTPVGEYGNSKRVSIYNDVRKWHQVKKYISEDVEIKEPVYEDYNSTKLVEVK